MSPEEVSSDESAVPSQEPADVDESALALQGLEDDPDSEEYEVDEYEEQVVDVEGEAVPDQGPRPPAGGHAILRFHRGSPYKVCLSSLLHVSSDSRFPEQLYIP